MALLAYRFAVAMVALVIISAIRGERVLPEKEIIKKVWPVTLLYPLGFFFFQIYGLSHLTSSQSGIISAFIPVMTLLVARVVLKEELGKRRSLFIGVSVLGVVLIFALGQGAGGRFIPGGIFMLICALSSALYNVYGKKVVEGVDPLSLAKLNIFSGFIGFHILFFIECLVKKTPYMAKGLLGEGQFVVALLYMAILATLITSYLLNFALSRIEASAVGVFNNLGTLISIFAGAVLLQEPLFAIHYIGAAMILLGVIGASGGKKKSVEK